jgi:hypothetical protein
MVTAIKRVLNDGALARQMGECARNAASRYSWTDRQKRILRFAAERFHGRAHEGIARTHSDGTAQGSAVESDR